jgi:hypothetical protein
MPLPQGQSLYKVADAPLAAPSPKRGKPTQDQYAAGRA